MVSFDESLLRGIVPVALAAAATGVGVVAVLKICCRRVAKDCLIYIG